ncbi:MAG: tyrosine--tRNA ligase [Planctomycetaceae bacterium]|jgi:tyrosyl-tRNA synthetase|nr:tyrosine--tRNA ligase [Planctomycetaceae bacterium]|tara:strand:- start:948 stop:2225 length:1278 start_codon:yes stop_codon:yes gene_type:complete
MNDLYADFTARGLIHQTTDELGPWLMEKPRTMYIGFDPTADSMHVGHLMQVMTLRRFQQAGHRPIALVGGATGMIGDPSGKSQERNLLTVEQLHANTEALKQQMQSFIDFDEAAGGAVLANNLDWMQKFSFLEFLRDIGKNFPVNVMLGKDSVKSRLEGESGLSYTEFSYMLLQAYDFAHLHQQYDCELQVGGSDQWGNITAGIDLGRRMHGASLYGMTCPLLTKSDGTKMGKTESGAIWLAPERTSPYKFYQYWINVADDDAGKCLRFLTELPLDEIDALDESRENEPHLRTSQKRLAEVLTLIVHRQEGLDAARKATEIFFGSEIQELNDAQLLDIFADVPSVEVSRDALAGGQINIIDALVDSGLCNSRGDARRAIEQGGGYVNNRRIESIDTNLTMEDLASETVIVLRRGKKKYALIRLTS